jgi:hypothetical protein
MPDAKLPTSLKGWFIAITASLVGFMSGFVTIIWLRKILG